jgi:hypothetical protein
MNKIVSVLAALTVGGTVLASGVATAAAAPATPGSADASKPHHVVRSTPSAHGKLSPLAAMPAPGAAHSNAKATPNEVFSVQMHNFASYRALDADTDTIGDNGTKVQLWDDGGGIPSQVWSMTTTDTEGVYKVANSSSPRVLDADTDTIGANGTTVQLWDDAGAGQTNQLWGLVDTLYYDTQTGLELYKWVNMQSGRVLDADADTIGDNGTKVQLWDDLGVDAYNQDWELTTA